MRVLMLGWEFPPYISGGLGTACYGLTHGLTHLGIRILFVLPSGAPEERSAGSAGGKTLFRAGGKTLVEFMGVPCPVRSPYVTAGWTGRGANESFAPRASTTEEPVLEVLGTGATGGYEGNLILRITEYAARCAEMTLDESFDAIHAHDWVTFPAGVAIAQRSGKPLVAHIHSTEFDRSGVRVNQAVFDIEREGMRRATSVIAVSNLTKGIIVDRYGLPAGKVHVVHNGVNARRTLAATSKENHNPKVVLFLGRITMQKGPEFFVRAARRILDKSQDIRFIIAGWGDLGPKVIDQVLAMGLGRKVQFTGFLRGREVDRAYDMADVYVMPSVSEPFGLTALEAIQHGVPVVLSKTSGVAEVLTRGALKCDFWDIDRMADMILAVLAHPQLAETLRAHGAREVRALTWDAAARKCVQVYRGILGLPDGVAA